MTVLNQVAAGAGADTVVNEQFRAVSPAGLYGIKSISGLVLTLYGGAFNGVDVSDASVTLTASNTNYVVANRTTGDLSVSTGTTNWNDQTTYMQLYQIVAGTSTMTIASSSDKRQAFGTSTLGAGTGDVVGPSSSTDSTIALFDGTTGKFLKDGGETIASLRAVAQNPRSADYTLALSDAGKHIYHPPADTTARTWTIPANTAVAFPIGSVVTFDNDYGAGDITIEIDDDDLVLVGTSGSTGSRTLASGGQATAIKVNSTRWRISGAGLS